MDIVQTTGSIPAGTCVFLSLIDGGWFVWVPWPGKVGGIRDDLFMPFPKVSRYES